MEGSGGGGVGGGARVNGLGVEGDGLIEMAIFERCVCFGFKMLGFHTTVVLLLLV